MKTIQLLAPFNRTFNKHNQGNKNLFNSIKVILEPFVKIARSYHYKH